MSALLEVHDLQVTFGNLRVLDGLDLRVEEGTLVGLIGPNGAGKTTTIDALTGFVACRGRIRLDGRDVTGLPVHRRAHLGLVRTWQTIELFDDLTVRENLSVAAERLGFGGFLADLVHPARRRDQRAVDDALELLGIGHLARHRPTQISHGQRKLVGVARALVARPRIVCMDEPAAGLDPDESRELGRELRRLVDEGTTILLVDHDMGLVLDVCDRVQVIDFGRRIAEGTPAEVERDPVVLEAYLGTSRETPT